MSGTQAETPDVIWNIPVSKGKGMVPVNVTKLPEHVYMEALRLGIGVLVNKFAGASKVTKGAYKTEDEYHQVAMSKATEQVELMLAGKIKIAGAKAPKGTSGAVMTEARRLARNVVKDEIKRQGGKVSHVEASEITKAANALIATDPWYIEQATKNLSEGQQRKVAIDVAAIPTSAKKIEAAEKRKASTKQGTDSAAKAGKTVPRAKGAIPPAKAQPQHHATH